MKIPAPYLYQAWKHHLPFLRERIERAQASGLEGADGIEGLKRTGDSVTDIYTGRMEVSELLRAIGENLGDLPLMDPAAYRNWLGDKGYRTLSLGDASRWVLKEADDPARWVHLHPARHGPLSVRVRGKTLRTAFMVCLEAAHLGIDPMSRELVDRVRASYMGLSPIRSLDRKEGLGRIIELLSERRTA